MRSPRLIAATALLALACPLSAMPAPAGKSEISPHASSARILVKACPERVYESILKLRKKTPDTIKELSRDANHSLLEETFPDLPVVGKARCVYKETYEPFERIGYKMVSSDKFKAFEGEWRLKRLSSGVETEVSLSSFVDLALPIPFGKQLTRMQTARGVKQRLKQVKTDSETRALSMK
ncbi:MAG: hypothetical protein IPM23_23505 [Candidatus Melainabacteria bacterium]|nr:hypothetical protein [Candidatus Melainabacteria bacterium]